MAEAIKLDFTKDAFDSLRDITRIAIAFGQGKIYAKCLESLIRKLKTIPRECGEPLFDLRAISIQVRILAQSPLSLTYGVHAIQPVVVIRSVADMQPQRNGHE